jgi:hypothetical protein
MGPFCNPIGAETHIRGQSNPSSAEGAMHEAACLALSGKIDRAHRAAGHPC